MVGEIRDFETAEIAMHAAQTGHFVLSTLHTNDAPGTLACLKHMGIPAFNVAASVSLVTAQLLLRRLCELCKSPMEAGHITALLGSLSQEEREHFQRVMRCCTKPSAAKLATKATKFGLGCTK
jgi:type IV pilus assembly protein PilB